MNVVRRAARSPLGLTLVLTAGLALALVAVHSVFLTEANEVAPQQAAVPQGQVSPEADALAPAAEAVGYNGQLAVGLNEFRGHPVVLNFWASWCPPCRAEVGVLEQAYLRYRGRGLVVIGIDAESDSWQTSALFLRQHGVTYPAGRDVRGTIARDYRIGNLPTTYFIGADGRIVGPPVMGGFTGSDGEQDLEREIRTLLQ